MQMRTPSPQINYQAIDVVGSSTFGKNPKVLASRTFNMFQSDDWLINYFGYKKDISISGDTGKGRCIFTSVKSNSMIVVISNFVYALTVYSTGVDGKKTFAKRRIGEVETLTGDVFIDENNVGQIAICDQLNLYIWDYNADTFQIAVLPGGFVPGYVTYQNGRFVAPDRSTDRWALSNVGNGLNWFWGASGEPVTSAIQTKPDFGRVTIRFPGRGNLLMVMGETVSELWTDVGGAIFPYKKNTSINFDYGCVNPATVATSEEFVAWLGTNERSESVIMFTNGSDINTLSTDGINNKLQNIVNPQKATAFFVKILGHLIYQLTFYDDKDNYSLMYDFTTNKFYDLTDENMDYHIARDVAFFQDEYYFISLNDGDVYLMSSELNTYDYGDTEEGEDISFEIPRIRVCSNFRMPNSSRFIVADLSFTMQQGNDDQNTINNPDYNPRIGLSISGDGGITFSSYVSRELNKSGNRRNMLEWWELGEANDFVPQLRFWGDGSWNAFDGVIGVYQ